MNGTDPMMLTMRQWVAISCGFSCILVAARMAFTGDTTYLFMIWNLFLALVPYLITEWLSRHSWMTGNRWKLAGILFLWLLFIPNSFYILTDLFHLDEFDTAPQWF